MMFVFVRVQGMECANGLRLSPTEAFLRQKRVECSSSIARFLSSCTSPYYVQVYEGSQRACQEALVEMINSNGGRCLVRLQSGNRS